ncbi:MAG TPA: TIGR02186 family protein [Stellaceae bacterium]|nr:TIGR02186 family protein [Stellaceae bacterium]
MRPALLLLLLLSWWCAPPAGAAEPLVADLSTHYIAITTGFTGKDVVLFGATDAPCKQHDAKAGKCDVVVVVRGPNGTAVVRRKSQIAGVWMNTLQVTFTGVPDYYAVYSTRPLDEIMSPAMSALNDIGANNLRLGVVEKDRTPQQIAEFRAALLRQQQRDDLFVEAVESFNFLNDSLFHLPLSFPANVPVGNYTVLTLLVRDKAVVGGQTSPLIISQDGIDAEVNDFADHEALAYGFVAVVAAAMAGWLASLPFRHA